MTDQDTLSENVKNPNLGETASSHSTSSSSHHSNCKRNVLRRNVSSSSSAPTTNTRTTSSSNNTEELEEREKCFGILPEYDSPQYSSSAVHTQEASLKAKDNSCSSGQLLKPDFRSKAITILDQTYTLLRTIGKGNFAVVRLAYHNLLKMKVAVKIIKKNSMGHEDWKRLSREMKAIQHLNHPHIIKLYQIIERTDDICLVMEHAACGEILDYIQCYGAFSEANACEIFWQLLSAVHYIHSKGVVHRDLKAENILLDKHLRVKLTDFGFCNFLELEEHGDGTLISTARLMRTHCGSPQYASPEVYRDEDYDGVMADVWSLGVVLYIMLCADFPFPGNSVSEIRARVLRGLVRVPYYISEDCSKLLHGMLMVDSKRRLKLDAIMLAPWMRSSPHLDKHLARIEKYSHNCEWLSSASMQLMHEAVPTSTKAAKLHDACRLLLQSVGWDLSHHDSSMSHYRESFDRQHATYELALQKILQDRKRRKRLHKKEPSDPKMLSQESSNVTAPPPLEELVTTPSSPLHCDDVDNDLVSSSSSASVSSSSSTSLGEELLLLTDSEEECKEESKPHFPPVEQRFSSGAYQSEALHRLHSVDASCRGFNKSFPTYSMTRCSRGASSFAHTFRGFSLKRQHTADDLSYDMERMAIESMDNNACPHGGSQRKMCDFRRASEGDELKLVEFHEMLLHQGGRKRGRLCRDNQPTRTFHPATVDHSGFPVHSRMGAFSRGHPLHTVTKPIIDFFVPKGVDTNVALALPNPPLNMTSPISTLKTSPEHLPDPQRLVASDNKRYRRGQNQLVQKWWMNRHQTTHHIAEQSSTISSEETEASLSPHQPEVMIRSPSEDMDLVNYPLQKRFSLPSGVCRRHSQTIKQLRPSRVLETDEEESHFSTLSETVEKEAEPVKTALASHANYTSRRASDQLHHGRGDHTWTLRNSDYPQSPYEVKEVLMELEKAATEMAVSDKLKMCGPTAGVAPICHQCGSTGHSCAPCVARLSHPVVVITPMDATSSVMDKGLKCIAHSTSPPPPITCSSNFSHSLTTCELKHFCGIPPSASQMSSLSTTSNAPGVVTCALPFSPSFSSSVDADSGLSSSYLLTEQWLHHRASTATTGTGFSSCDMGYQSRRASPTQQLTESYLSGKWGSFCSKRSSYSSVGGVNLFPLSTAISPLKPIKHSRTRYGLGRNHPYYLPSQTSTVTSSNYLSVDQAMRRLTLSGDDSTGKCGTIFSITGQDPGSMNQHTLPPSTSRRHSMPCIRKRSIINAQNTNRIDSYLTLHEYLLTITPESASSNSTTKHPVEQSETNVESSVPTFTASSSSSSSSGGETRAIELVNLQHNYPTFGERGHKTPLSFEPPRILIEMATEEDVTSTTIVSPVTVKEGYES